MLKLAAKVAAGEKARLTIVRNGKEQNLVLETREGEARVKCDRIIARIGALPPRKFVESCGIVFPSESPTAYTR